MTTNQTTEALFMIRQTMLYPASQSITKRLLGLHGNVREQIELKIFKVSCIENLLTIDFCSSHLTNDVIRPISQRLLKINKWFKGIQGKHREVFSSTN